MADRISNLSDSLLCHILSFLPTKEAVATSILSKRWRPLWLYTPSFDFEDGLYASNKIQYLHFVQFVYAFLVSRDVQPIKRFHLNCVSSYTSNQNIKVWINAAIHRQVEHLEFKRLPDDIFLPSSTIFTCKTIVVMKLNSEVEQLDAYKFKILHLRSVHFSKISCVPKLLSGCSTLLENLVIRYIHLSHKAIDYPHVFTKDFPKLISANVHIYNWDLLRAFSKAKFIHYEFPELYFGRKCNILIPIFHNLVHMELKFIGHYNWNFLGKILGNSPNLQILILKKESNYEAYTNDHFVGAEIPLPPLLRKCYVGGFDGKGSEMQFARFIMKNATLLNTITISSSSLSSLDEKHGMLKKLSSIPRLSSACQLYFE